MPLHKELQARLHDALALELNLRAYLREWQTHVTSPALRLGLERAVTSIGPEADGLAKCLHVLGVQARLASESPLVEVFRQQDRQRHAEAPLETDLRCAISILALGDVKASLYRSMLALAAAVKNPQLEATLREILGHVEHDHAHLQEVFETLLSGVDKGPAREGGLAGEGVRPGSLK